MTLGEFIDKLEAMPSDTVSKVGISEPHSYRGYYQELAFEPAPPMTAGEMLKVAKSALGATYTGYKGGDFYMNEHTLIHLSYYGRCGEEFGPTLFRLIFDLPLDF